MPDRRNDAACRRRRRLAGALYLAAVVCLPFAPSKEVRANDSVAHLAAGGLVLARSDDIEMRSEDLYVSTGEVRVRYRFFNRSDDAIETLVAFPLPDLTAPSDYNNFVIPVDAPQNFLGFATTVDGKTVAMQLEQRAVALGIDRTDDLKQLGVPLAPHVETTTAALDALPQADQARLHRHGLIAWDEYDIGRGMERHVRPDWSLRTTYYWQQVFPARTEVVVEHTYTPSVGASAQTSLGSEYADASIVGEYERRYCTEPSFVAAAERIQKSGKAVFSEHWVEYVLTTGANWAGPIAEFRLVVDKGSPDNLVSFCGEDVKKISPTQFEMRRTDYWPDRNLEVLILERHDIDQ